MKLVVKDLLNQDRKLIQRSLIGDKPVQVENFGRTVSLNIGYSL